VLQKKVLLALLFRRTVVEKYPPWERIASPTDLRKKYESARSEIINYKKSAQLANQGTKIIAKDREKYKKEAKVAKGQVVRLSKKQKATEEAKKAGYWSGASTIAITILYETWKVVGFPGGREWMGWWEHEAIYGVMVWISTCTLGWFYKASHKDS
jgi:hypothetical protein